MFIQLSLLVVNVCLQSYTFCYTDEFTAVPVPSVRFFILINLKSFSLFDCFSGKFCKFAAIFITDLF